MFKAFTNALRVGKNQNTYIMKNYVDNMNAYIWPNKQDSLAAYLIKICTCKSFHDENSAHKYCKDEASLHCEFLDVLSKLFCLTKAVKFNLKQCHCQFEVKDYHFLNFFNSDGSQYIQITASVYSDTHTYTFKGSMATYYLLKQVGLKTI